MKELLSNDIKDFFIPITNQNLEGKIWFRAIRVIHGIMIVLITVFSIWLAADFGRYWIGFFSALLLLILLRIIISLLIYIIVGGPNGK